MQPLFYELSVLAKSVKHKNLSAAAQHVGLSQPQLSRILHKLEDELKIVLLDRGARRKSGWTPIAEHVAHMFEGVAKNLETELQAISQNFIIMELKIGTLEGLSEIAINLTNACFRQIGIQQISVDIFDLNDLEAHFLSGNIDIMLSSRTPGRQKFSHLMQLGFQKLVQTKTSDAVQVLSTYEFASAAPSKKSLHKRFISNSLAIRKTWIQRVGGYGLLPSEPKRGRSEADEPILVIGSEILSPLLWEKISQILKEIRDTK